MSAYFDDFEPEEATDITEGSFLEFAQSESYVSPGERAWERWVAKVEKVLGHDLDGDQERDGYSMDYAFAAFEDGRTVEQYLIEVAEDKAAIAKARS